MFSIKSKIIFAYTLVFGVMLSGFSFIIFQSTKHAEFQKLEANLKSYSVALQTEIAEELSKDGELDLKELRSVRAKGLGGVRFQLFNSSHKKILSDSILSQFPEINFNQAEKQVFHYSKFHIQKESFKILWIPFETEQDSLYVLETAASMKDAYEDLDRLFYIFIIIIPLGLILTGIMAYFISKAAFKPITQMAETAKKITGNNLDQKLKLPKAKDEVRALGETLNEMVERLDNAFKSQKRFVADASHEIRTPLTVIQTELEILERKLTDIEAKESIKSALNEIEGLTKLTSSLLTLSKLDSSQIKLNLTLVRLDELLTECVQLLNRQARKKNVQLNLQINDAAEVKGDKEKLKSVFVNLLDNAIKFSNTNSSVSIKLEITGSKIIKIYFEDNGCGIPAQELPYIFKRFYRSNETRAEIIGNGLGLAIAKEIVDMHKGEITVSSEVGTNTVFSVILPMNII
ncbi:MAG: HAMP domain-containing sensor histidine kinase [Ignavibacteriaceae bacterium]